MDARVKEIEARCEGFWTDTLTGKVYWVLHLEFTPDDYKKSIAKKRAELKANYAALRESAEREEKLVDAENKRLSEENERLQGQIDDVADALGCKEKTSHRHSHGRCLYAGISKIEHDWAALVVAEKRKLTAALTVLKAVEWVIHGFDSEPFCPKCRGLERANHVSGCELAAVLNNGGATDGR